MNPNHSDPPAELRFQPQSTVLKERQSSSRPEDSSEYDAGEPSGEDALDSREETGGSRKRQRPMSVS